MNMNRRSFLASILASGVAPYVVTGAGVLMPCRSLALAEVRKQFIDNAMLAYRGKWHTEWVDPFALPPSTIMIFEYEPTESDTVRPARQLIRGWDSGIGRTPSASPRAP